MHTLIFRPIRLRTPTSLSLLAVTALMIVACGDDDGASTGQVDTTAVDTDEPGDTGSPDVAEDVTVGDTLEAADTADHDTLTAGDTAAPDTAVFDTMSLDTTPPSVCGNLFIEADEACDDGNDCAGDGCTAGCVREPTVVLGSLAVDGSIGFDLDNADGDDNIYTGIDNAIGANPLVAQVLNPYIQGTLNSGNAIQLVTITNAPDLTDASEPTLTFHPGVDPSCPESPSPVPWVSPLETDADPHPIFGDATAFPGCIAPVQVTDTTFPANGIFPEPFAEGQPEGPLLFASVEGLVIPTGVLGDLDVQRGHIEATLSLDDTGQLRGLDDGRLGGILKAELLYGIDTSALLPGCPTALHAVLAFAGHIDQDIDGAGADWIQFTLAGTQAPCIVDAVTIVGCCNDGDCVDGFISGEDCALDDAIEDGYSAGLSFHAPAVHVQEQVDPNGCAP